MQIICLKSFSSTIKQARARRRAHLWLIFGKKLQLTPYTCKAYLMFTRYPVKRKIPIILKDVLQGPSFPLASNKKFKTFIHPHIQGPPNTFFLENALEKTTEYFPKFLFLFESTILPVNNGK